MVKSENKRGIRELVVRAAFFLLCTRGFISAVAETAQPGQ